MSTIHPFERATEFPNYFEIMLNSVPKTQRDVFLRKIRALIEQNINTIIKNLKLSYVDDSGELSTKNYFDALVKRMDYALEESSAKNDYHLEVYISGGVVRALLSSIYKRLYINIQEILESELNASEISKDKGKILSAVLTELGQETDQQVKIKTFENILKRKHFLETFTKTPEFWLRNLKTQQALVRGSDVLGVGSDMDILYKLSYRTPKYKIKLNDTQLQELDKVLWNTTKLNKAQKKELYRAVKAQTLNESQLKDLQEAIQNQHALYAKEQHSVLQAIETTRELDKEHFDKEQAQELSNTEKTAKEQYELHRQQLQDLETVLHHIYKLPAQELKESQELYETIKKLMEIDKEKLEKLEQDLKDQKTLDTKQWKLLKQAINNLNKLTNKEAKELQQAIYDKTPLTPEQRQDLALAIQNQHTLNDEQWNNLPLAIQAGHALNTEQLQKFHRAINMQRQLNLKNVKKKIHAAGDAFLNSASNFFKLSDVEETLKNSLLPPGDINEYTKQTKNSMSQGGSALDWLAFELSPKEGRKLVEPPSDLKQKAKLQHSIVESFIHGHYEYLESQVEESIAIRIVRVIRGIRFIFEDPAVTILDATVILKELENIEKLAVRDANGKIILPPNALKQLEKLRRNTNFEGAHNLIYRLDPKNIVLLKFLEISKQFAPPIGDGKNVHFPKYVQRANPLDKTPATGQYRSEINNLFIDTKTFIADFTDAGTLYHGTPLAAVPAIIRGGFYISASTQGTAAYGSGLYSTKDRTVAIAASPGGIVLPLHINTDQTIKVINLNTINRTLLEKLEDEARKEGFLGIHGEPEVNELLKIRYKVDIIIYTHVLIQNAAVVKPPKLADLSLAHGTQFQRQFLENIKLGDKSFRFISDNARLQEVNQSFKCYINLCLLSGSIEGNPLSPANIIKDLLTHVEQIEKIQTDFKTHNTRLFIYAHCFLINADYVRNHLADICARSNNNPEIIAALTKFANPFAINFKKNGRDDHHKTFSTVLKNIIFCSRTNNSIIGIIDDLKLMDSQELNNLLEKLISDGEITPIQALYAVLAASNIMKNDLVLYLWNHVNKIDPHKITQEEQNILNQILINSIKSDSNDIINKLLSTYTFHKSILINALCIASNLKQKDMVLNLLDLIKKKEPENIPPILHDVFINAINHNNIELVKALLKIYNLNDTTLTQALSLASNARQRDMVLYLLDRINEMELKNVPPTILEAVFINAAKDGSIDIINKLLMYTPNEQVLTQALKLASEAQKNDMVLYLFELIHKNKIDLKNIDSAVLDKVFINAVKHNFIDALLTACALNNKALILALSTTAELDNIKMLSEILDCISENKIVLEHVEPTWVRNIVAIVAFQQSGCDFKIIEKLSKACAFNAQVLIHILAELLQLRHHNAAYNLLDLMKRPEINLQNTDSKILDEIINKHIYVESVICQLIRTYAFDKRVLTQALIAASNTDDTTQHDIVCCLLKLINAYKINLQHIDPEILKKIIIKAVHDNKNIDVLLTTCEFNESLLIQMLIATSGNGTTHNAMISQLFAKHPKLVIVLARHENFDQYLSTETQQQLIAIRSTPPTVEDPTSFLPQFRIHQTSGDEPPSSKQKQVLQDGHSITLG